MAGVTIFSCQLTRLSLPLLSVQLFKSPAMFDEENRIGEFLRSLMRLVRGSRKEAEAVTRSNIRAITKMMREKD